MGVRCCEFGRGAEAAAAEPTRTAPPARAPVAPARAAPPMPPTAALIPTCWTTAVPNRAVDRAPELAGLAATAEFMAVAASIPPQCTKRHVTHGANRAIERRSSPTSRSVKAGDVVPTAEPVADGPVPENADASTPALRPTPARRMRPGRRRRPRAEPPCGRPGGPTGAGTRRSSSCRGRSAGPATPRSRSERSRRTAKPRQPRSSLPRLR